MGKLDAHQLRELSNLHFRVLSAVEMGMKNHEYVPAEVVSALMKRGKGHCYKILQELSKTRLVAYQGDKRCSGYRLTWKGYDYLALRTFCNHSSVTSFGNQIGVGKESDVYIVADENGEQRALKLHRLGRTSFRQVRTKRDYHKNRRSPSWLYLSRLAAQKEFAFMTALYKRGLPVPKPVDWNRHGVVMELVAGIPMCQAKSLRDVGAVYSDCMDLVLQLASWGVVHGDFNEFNLMLDDGDRITMIDFPQMVSTKHPDAEMYFNRDVECIRTFFSKRFRYDSELAPDFKQDVKRRGNIDKEVAASGFNKKLASEFDKVAKRLNLLVPETERQEELVEEDDEDDSEDDDSENNEDEGSNIDDDDNVKNAEESQGELSERCSKTTDGGEAMKMVDLRKASCGDRDDEEEEEMEEEGCDEACGTSYPHRSDVTSPDAEEESEEKTSQREARDDDDEEEAVESDDEEEEEEELSYQNRRHRPHRDAQSMRHQNSHLQRVRNSPSIGSAASASFRVTSEAEIERRVNSERKKLLQKEQARRLRKSAKSTQNNKLRKENKYTMQTSLSGAWY